MGTIAIPAVLYSDRLAQIRSMVHHIWLPVVKCEFIVGHLAKNEAVQKFHVTEHAYTAVLVGAVRATRAQQTVLYM